MSIQTEASEDYVYSPNRGWTIGHQAPSLTAADAFFVWAPGTISQIAC
jgi:hypothetical protein